MELRCEEVQRVIPWLLDDELDAEQCLEVEEHVGQCASCQAVVQQEGALRVALRRAGASVYAPASLRRRVQNAIDQERGLGGRYGKLWPAAMAAAVLLAFMWRGAYGGLAYELSEVTQRHARDLPMDVEASSSDAIERYLSAKLPFTVRVPVIEQPQLAGVGGRVIRLGGHDAAQLRYTTNRGRVSVFVYEDRSGRGDESEVAPAYLMAGRRVMVKRVRGFTTARWRSAGLVYSVVTDLPEQELNVTLHELR